MGSIIVEVLRETFDMNPITWMWLKVQSSLLLVLKLNEYMKVVDIVMVQVLDLVEGERTFNNLIFMKSKLHNQLTTHLNLCVRVFTQNFYNVTYDTTTTTWKKLSTKQMGSSEFATCIS